MGISSEIFHKGASRLRSRIIENQDLKQKIAEFDELKNAITTVETLVKAGRLEDSDESIVKRAEALMAATNYELLTKEATSGNAHIDVELFKDLEIGPPREKSASAATEAEIDTEHNTFHRFIYGEE